MIFDLQSLRTDSRTRDIAILDLLQLEQLGVVPGSIKTERLCSMWNVSQSQVSRRMAAVHGLGIYSVQNGYGRYKIFTKYEVCAQRWERAKRRLVGALI